MIPLRWIGPIQDHSGYGSATRNYIGALVQSEQIDLTITPVTFESSHTSYGKLEESYFKYLNRAGVNYNIQVIHLTPENYPQFIQSNKYNIAYTTWETDKLPKSWTELCNLVDEVWVPSSWNKKVFESNGVHRPIYVIPHCVDYKLKKNVTPLSIGLDKDTFVFYSIFQWIARKNPIGLLKAYLTEFMPNENVCLALKTYRLNTSIQEKDIIKQDIQNIKNSLALTDFPPIRFFGDLLSFDQMQAFHKRGDCFVLPHCAEGFGLPLCEAMLYSKPVISTGYGGNLDFMNKENSYLIDYQETPVCNMMFHNYNGHMTWAEPSVSHLKKLMRYVFEHRDEAKAIGLVAHQQIKKQLSWNKISQKIINRLYKIEMELNSV
jgi:glycosyltransferase involved in cell wall biosynthesis